MQRVYFNAETHLIDFTMSHTPGFEPPSLADHPFIVTDMVTGDITNWMIIDNEPILITDVSAAVRSAADAQVNVIIGRARALFITDTPGQQMTYLAKQTESKELLAMANEPADPSVFPFLYAEIGITGTNITMVAQTVMNLAYQWGLIGSNLEKIRMGTNARIATATTRIELIAIKAAFKTNLSNLLAAVGHTIDEVDRDDF